ncbi:hypothetical protein SAMN02927937_01399 [Paenimyroides aquimaris]|uniref:Uncharacterized protein n=1 Tax=Paenimyroides marinum TaxID=1159016 RepID=A0A1H6L1D8_9FLAO|nr:hypothetical protein [Paenimyroides aquimaris]SEH78092.1 hypothetical protein SAMN02927937_01399 [Paenimyroides aquimaris]
MKKIALSILAIIYSLTVFSQEISIQTEMDETKFEQTLKTFEGYSYYNFKFVTNETASLNFEIIEKEFVQGELKNEKVYFDSKNVLSNLIGNSISTTILAKSTSDTNYKMMLQFYEFYSLIRNFDLNNEDQYHFKIFINEAQKFTYNQVYLFCAIVKPIKIAENTYRDCDFAAAIDKYDKWYEIFGLDRYFVYEIRFY